MPSRHHSIMTAHAREKYGVVTARACVYARAHTCNMPGACAYAYYSLAEPREANASNLQFGK